MMLTSAVATLQSVSKDSQDKKEEALNVDPNEVILESESEDEEEEEVERDFLSALQRVQDSGRLSIHEFRVFEKELKEAAPNLFEDKSDMVILAGLQNTRPGKMPVIFKITRCLDRCTIYVRIQPVFTSTLWSRPWALEQLEPFRVQHTKSARLQQAATFHGSGAQQQLAWKHSGIAQQQTELLGNSPKQQRDAQQERRAWSQLRQCGGLSTQWTCSSRINRSRWSRCTFNSTQAEAETTNIRWQLCNIRWMEIQVHSIHGHTRSYLPNTNGESWASNNCNSRVTAHSRSQYNTRRRTLDTARSKSHIRPHHHYYSSSSNSGQTTSPSNGTWGIQATMSQVLNTIGNKKHWLSN